MILSFFSPVASFDKFAFNLESPSFPCASLSMSVHARRHRHYFLHLKKKATISKRVRYKKKKLPLGECYKKRRGKTFYILL